MLVITIIYIIILVLLFLSSHTRFYLYIRSAASICFIVVAIAGGVVSNAMPAVLSALPGLVCLIAGDMIISLHSRYSDLYGLLAFILGNIFFLSFYHRYTPFYGRMFIFPIIMLGIYSVLDYEKFIDLKRLNVYGGIYVFTASFLLSVSVIAMILKSSMFFTMMAISLMLYFGSMVFLALYRFKIHFSLLHFLTLLFYYSGLYLVIASFFYM